MYCFSWFNDGGSQSSLVVVFCESHNLSLGSTPALFLQCMCLTSYKSCRILFCLGSKWKYLSSFLQKKFPFIDFKPQRSEEKLGFFVVLQGFFSMARILLRLFHGSTDICIVYHSPRVNRYFCCSIMNHNLLQPLFTFCAFLKCMSSLYFSFFVYLLTVLEKWESLKKCLGLWLVQAESSRFLVLEILFCKIFSIWPFEKINFDCLLLNWFRLQNPIEMKIFR